MGVTDLWPVSDIGYVVSSFADYGWKLLEPAAQVINLREFTTTEGFEQNFRGNHMLYIGVDAKYILPSSCYSYYAK